MRKERDNIPGFRDTTYYLEKVFESKDDADKYCEELQNRFGGSVYHEGYGAGDGSIDTRYFVEESEEE